MWLFDKISEIVLKYWNMLLAWLHSLIENPDAITTVGVAVIAIAVGAAFYYLIVGDDYE